MTSTGLQADRDRWIELFCEAEMGRRRNRLALDVLRTELAPGDDDTPAWKRVAYQRRELRHLTADRNRLRAVIENAPHDRDTCKWWWSRNTVEPMACTCWKADVL